MSLLMDALKKAELAKQQGQGGEETAPPEKPSLELEPLASPGAGAPTPASLPELPAQLESLDHEFIAHAAADKAKAEAPKKAAAPRPAAPKPPPAARQEPSATFQAQAQNVFAAKQPTGGNKVFALAVGITTLVAVAGIGIYFWLQLQPAGGLQATAPLAAAPRPAPTPAPAAAPALPPLVARAPEPEQATPAPEAKPAAAPVPRPAAEPESPIRVTRGTLKLNPALARGFDAFNGGDLAAAAASYEQVLKADPRNADALHGLAAIALRQGRGADAEAIYLRALEADPRDAVAQADLVGLRGGGDPVAAESRLKTLIAGQPGQPFLHFALGNVYAGQKRWGEAQQAYFKAMSGDPENPDYLFNLAVSLDELHQGRLAAQYYNQAVAAASQRPAGFDKAQAEARLRELQP